MVPETSPNPRINHRSKAARSGIKSATAMSQPARRSIDRNSKTTRNQSPKSPSPEKHHSQVPGIDSKITQLQANLRLTREQLVLTEYQRRQAEKEAEEANKQLFILYTEYENSEQQKVELAASEEARIQELCKLSQERDRAWQSELEALENQRSFNWAALSSAMNEIHRLKMHLTRFVKSESAHAEQSGITHSEVEVLKHEIVRTRSTVEQLEIQLKETEIAKAKAEATDRKTQNQLEIAKTTAETLLSDGYTLMQSFNFVASELEKSRSQENLFEQTIKKLKAEQLTVGSPARCGSLESEVEQLRLALEAAEIKRMEEQICNIITVQSAYELVEQLRNESILREADLQSALANTKATILELKSKLIVTEAKFRGLSDMNEMLHSKIKQQQSLTESSLDSELIQSTAETIELKAKLTDKQTELQGILQENELLQLEMGKRNERHKISEATISEMESARAKEQEALMKLGIAAQESEISSARAVRLTEQLDAAQAIKEEMEVELKRLRVQSEQWRKAAENAVEILTAGEDESFVEKLMKSAFSDELEDKSQKTRNNNLLNKIGELWKKYQK